MEKEADPGADLLMMPIRQEMDAPVRGGYFRATRSLWSMRWTNAAMSARAIMP